MRSDNQNPEVETEDVFNSENDNTIRRQEWESIERTFLEIRQQERERLERQLLRSSPLK
jgi:hypothetical protein